MPKILFLTTSHRYDDDRIFYHQAKSLQKEGFEVKICSLSSDNNSIEGGIEIEAHSVLGESTSTKLRVFREVIERFSPDLILASEPLAIFAAYRFRMSREVSVIYDITEWYPSMRMLSPYPLVFRFLQGIKFFLIQCFAGFLSTAFIFGEDTKKFPLAYLFPFKKRIILPYYPDKEYVNFSLKPLKHNRVTLCYTGVFSKEKGVGHFFNAVEHLKNKRKDLEIRILLIGSSRKKEDEAYFKSLLKKHQWIDIEILKPVPFYDFSRSYQDADILFDLRDGNFENNHCLPIKLFYYMASGKPVVYTNLKAIRLHLNVLEFGFLVDPESPESIAEAILNYVDHPELYNKHAKTARNLYELYYSWDVIKTRFIGFVKTFVK